MLYRFKNKTNSIQQIDPISGAGIKVMPRSPQGGYVDIDISNLYKEELQRVQKFFEITPVEPKPVKPEPKVEKKYDFPRNKRRI